MSQIMALARSLGGGQPSSGPAPPPPEAPPPDSAPSGVDLSSALGSLDPRLISLAMRLAEEYNSNNDDRDALLNALRPFVKPERYGKLDKAIQISKLTRVIRVALDSFRPKGEENGHV